MSDTKKSSLLLTTVVLCSLFSTVYAPVCKKSEIKRLSDNHIMATASDDGVMKIWDIYKTEGSPLMVDLINNNKKNWKDAIFDPFDKKTIIAVSEPTLGTARVKIWNFTDGKCVKSWAFKKTDLSSIAANPFEKDIVACGTKNGIIKILNFNNGKIIKNIKLKDDTNLILMKYSPFKKNILAVAGNNKKIYVLNTKNGTLKQVLGGSTFSFSPFFKEILAYADGNKIKFYNILTSHSNNMEIIKTIVTAPIRLLSPSTEQFKKAFTAYEPIKIIAFSLSDKNLLAYASDKKIKILDTKTGECVMAISGKDPIKTLSFSPYDPKIIIAGYENGKTRVFDAQTGRFIRAFRANSSRAINAVRFIPKK